MKNQGIYLLVLLMTGQIVGLREEADRVARSEEVDVGPKEFGATNMAKGARADPIETTSTLVPNVAKGENAHVGPVKDLPVMEDSVVVSDPKGKGEKAIDCPDDPRCT